MNKYALVLCALPMLVCACGASDSASSAGSYKAADAGYSNAWGGSYGAGAPIAIGMGGSMAAGGSPAALPPEQEQKLDFLAPQAGAHYVYVANPSRNSVSVIDSSTLGIIEQFPGDSPTYVATVPGQDIALVINAGSHTLRILTGADMNDSPIPIVNKANTIAIAPDGLHAVIWFDASQLGTGGSTTATTATGSSQEVSVVDLSPTAVKDKVVISMSVGYNPSAVVFSSDSAAAFVVTDDGIFELRFASITAPAIAPFTPIENASPVSFATDAGAPLPSAPDALPLDGGAAADSQTSSFDGGATSVDGGSTTADGGAKETVTDLAPAAPATFSGKPVDVSVTSAGDYAIARRDGSPELLLVNLTTHDVTSLIMSSQVTDLDLLPSGKQAFAVLRDESKLVRIDIPEGFTGGKPQVTRQFDGAIIGSVTMSAKGKYALLYTTAIPSKTLVIFDIVQDKYRIVDLTKAIRAIAITPDENSALVLNTAPTASGSGGNTGQSSTTTSTGYGYTMVHLEDGYFKVVDTPANPNPFAITPDSTCAFVLLRDDKASVRIAERISLTSYLIEDFPLGSPPNSIAALSGSHNVFVGQVYSEGRISFIDWTTESGNVRTVTGFALNGRIQQ
jgi:YVTN family beta-propeller protein